MSEAEAWFARLRAETRDGHQALDRHELLAPLLRSDLGLASYGRALKALLAPQEALEIALCDFAPAEVFTPRAPDLRADLHALGLPLPSFVPRPPGFPGEAGRLGAMYVVEGSLFGAVVIARQIARNLPQAPCAFYGRPIEEVRQRWRKFQQFVGDHPARRELDDAIAGARGAFAFFRQHLDG